jgi:hypothetical protein
MVTMGFDGEKKPTYRPYYFEACNRKHKFFWGLINKQEVEEVGNLYFSQTPPSLPSSYSLYRSMLILWKF